MEFKLAAAGALVLLAFAGFFIPALGILAVVAALYGVPGVVLVSLLGRRLGLLEAAVVAVTASFLVSAHVAYWVAVLFGYGRLAVVAVVVLLCASLALARLQDVGVAVGKAIGKVSAGVRRYALLSCIVLLFLASLLFYYHHAFWAQRDGGFVVGGWNYGDSFMHLPVIRSINEGNFPPQTPFFAGAPLAYHYFVDLHSAVASKFFGGGFFEVVEVVRLENSLLPVLFFLAVFLFARRVTGRDSTALLAAVLVVFGGGFAFLKLAQAVAGGGDFLQLAGSEPFDNDWQFFQVPSLLGGFLLTQRALMVGLPAFACVLLLLVAAWQARDEKLYLSAGVMAGLLAPFHYYAFAASLFAIAVFLFSRFLRDGSLPARRVAACFLPAVFSLPFALNALATTSGAGNVKLAWGWLAPGDALGFAAFYAANLGLAFLLAVAALLLRFEWKRELLAVGAFCFLLPNVSSLSGTVWDMAKFFTFMAVPVGVMAALLLDKVPRALLLVLLVFIVATPLQMLYWHCNSEWQGLSDKEVEAGLWLSRNTPADAVFVTGSEHNVPVDSVAGRLRVVGYASWTGNFGLSSAGREALVAEAFCGSSAAERRLAIVSLNASFLYSGPSERQAFHCTHGEGLRKVFDNGISVVFELP